MATEQERLDTVEQVLREIIEEIRGSTDVGRRWHRILDGQREHSPYISTSLEYKAGGEPLFNVHCTCGWQSCSKLMAAISATWESHVKNGGRS